MKRGNNKKGKNHRIEIRKMEIDDLAVVFHLGERLFTSQRVPNLYRMWDEFEITSIFQDDPELCIVAEVDGKLAGFAVGTTYTKYHSAWKYGHLIWLGVAGILSVQGRHEAFQTFQRHRGGHGRTNAPDRYGCRKRACVEVFCKDGIW